MTREELQRLHDRWVECRDMTRVPWSGVEYVDSVQALLAGVGDFLAEPDPTVEIAYLKAKVADLSDEYPTRWTQGRRPPMSHDDIRAALEAATPGPWESTPLGSEGYTVTGAPDPGATGVRAKVRLRIARFGYQDWDTDRANAELVANAPEWLDDLLGEVGLLRTLKHRHEQTITELAARAEAAEQAIQRVRWQCDSWSHGNSWNKAARNAILRALDGGEQHG